MAGFSIFTHQRNTIPFTGETALRRVMLVTNLVVGAEGHCKVYLRVYRQFWRSIPPANELLWNCLFQGGQVIANTATPILLNTEREI